MKRMLREPLVHFLLIGVIIFGVYAALNSGKQAPPEDIVVTASRIESIAETFTRASQRPPSAEELKVQIDQYVKEEAFSREAVKLGLDQNDTIIRRRLQQKLEFLAEDFAAADEPTERELANYLAKHLSDFAPEQRFTFRQVFLDPRKRGTNLDADATSLLARLKQEGTYAGATTLGDRLLLPEEFTDESQRDVAAQFGQGFAAEIAKTRTGEWSGPLQSGYGVHLVFLVERTGTRTPALAEVREQVKRDLMNSRRVQANQEFLENVLARYRVTIHPPEVEARAEVDTTAMTP